MPFFVVFFDLLCFDEVEDWFPLDPLEAGPPPLTDPPADASSFWLLLLFEEREVLDLFFAAAPPWAPRRPFKLSLRLFELALLLLLM